MAQKEKKLTAGLVLAAVGVAVLSVGAWFLCSDPSRPKIEKVEAKLQSEQEEKLAKDLAAANARTEELLREKEKREKAERLEAQRKEAEIEKKTKSLMLPQVKDAKKKNDEKEKADAAARDEAQKEKARIKAIEDERDELREKLKNANKPSLVFTPSTFQPTPAYSENHSVSFQIEKLSFDWNRERIKLVKEGRVLVKKRDQLRAILDFKYQSTYSIPLGSPKRAQLEEKLAAMDAQITVAQEEYWRRHWEVYSQFDSLWQQPRQNRRSSSR